MPHLPAIAAAIRARTGNRAEGVRQFPALAKTRLDRDMSARFATEHYAMEELVAGAWRSLIGRLSLFNGVPGRLTSPEAV